MPYFLRFISRTIFRFIEILCPIFREFLEILRLSLSRPRDFTRSPTFYRFIVTFKTSQANDISAISDFIVSYGIFPHEKTVIYYFTKRYRMCRTCIKSLFVYNATFHRYQLFPFRFRLVSRVLQDSRFKSATHIDLYFILHYDDILYILYNVFLRRIRKNIFFAKMWILFRELLPETWGIECQIKTFLCVK